MTAEGTYVRRRERFGQLLQAARLVQPELNLARVEKALEAAAEVDAGAIAQQFPPDIAARLDEARRQAIAKALRQGTDRSRSAARSARPRRRR